MHEGADCLAAFKYGVASAAKNSQQLWIRKQAEIWLHHVCKMLLVHEGDDGLAAFKYLMASGAKYNQQAWKEVGVLPPQPPSPTKLTELQQKQSINLKATT